MKSLVLFLLILAASVTPVTAKVYSDNFQPNQAGIFGDILGAGQESGWTFTPQPGLFQISNFDQGGSVRFFHILSIKGEPQAALANAGVTLQVSGEFKKPISGAGLIYRYDPAAGSYWAFVVNGQEGSYAIYKRDAGGLRPVMSGSHSAIKVNAPNMLFIGPGAEGQVNFAVNGQKVGSLSSPGITGHAVGLLAISPGSFRFQRFRLETSTP